MAWMNVYDEETSLLARIAWMYYIQGMTQEEVAEKLKFSRTKVTRMLAKARDAGIVEININNSFRSCLDTEDMLKNRLKLQEVIIVPTGNTEEETKAGVGKACAAFIEQILEDGDILGIAWGTSLYNAGKYLRVQKPRNITVIQLMGGLNVSEKINPQEILKLIASKLNATGVWLNTPAIVDTPKIKKALLSDEGVSRALERGKSCTKAIIGLGDVTNDASLIACNALTTKDMEELKSMGAVGDILSWFFDINGVPIQNNMAERAISVPLEDIKKIPLRIGVTAGVRKAGAILGAIRGGYLNALVTDEKTAKEVLRLNEQV